MFTSVAAVEIARLDRRLLAREMVAQLVASSPTSGSPEPISTSRETWSGWANAVRSATAPPNELPTSAAGRCAATRSTSENGSVGSGSVPQPGRSGATTS